MTGFQLAIAFARLAAIALPAVAVGHLLRGRYLRVTGSVGVLADAVLSLSLVLVLAESAGLVGLMRPMVLIPVLLLLSVVAWWASQGAEWSGTLGRSERGVAGPDAGVVVTTVAAGVGVSIVAAQWCLQTGDALGAGMFNFDTLWYHMPFAAQMAQTHAVTGVQFTQADPFVAYYPANSELFHAIGIAALHNDLLSPLLNLLWLAIALLASWCLGGPWRVERLTLIVGCLVAGLPVLGGTQPGEAFNDITGLAMLLAGAAFVVNADDDRSMLALGGLALGLAVGTKFTFVVPAVVLAAGIALWPKRPARWPTLGVIALPLLLTAGWWYLRNLVAVGNPLGQRLHLGPIVLPGPVSPLESASQQTVASELGHLSLWGSRFAPGLDHALGPLWPAVLALYVAGVVAGFLAVRDYRVRVLALAAALSGISYLFLPTGATALERGTSEFQVNLRYVTPAFALGLMLVPIVLRLRAPQVLTWLGFTLMSVLAATQLEHVLWPTQTARHLAFLATAAAVVAGVVVGRKLRRPSRRSLATAVAGIVVVAGAGTFIVQRHYFNRRYRVGDKTDAGLGIIYGWAQGVAHSRIGLYGTVLQYPLYGARDTNRVDYLGAHTGGGGFRPIATCHTWRSTIDAGRYRYVVLTPAPTSAVPITWIQTSPAARLILHPSPADYVFEVTENLNPNQCPA